MLPPGQEQLWCQQSNKAAVQKAHEADAGEGVAPARLALRRLR